MNNNLSEKIKNFRKQNNLTQEQLAEKLVVSRQAVSKWEQGRGYPDIKTLELLSQTMSSTIDELLSNSETKLLTVSAAAKLNSAKRFFVVATCCLLALLIATTTVFSLILLDKQKSHLKGLVGFYIDIDKNDGEILLDSMNPADVYFINKPNFFNGYLSSGVTNINTSTSQHGNGTSFKTTECFVNYKLLEGKSGTIFEVLENADGELYLQKYLDFEPSDFQIFDLLRALLSFAFYDYATVDGKLVGRGITFYLSNIEIDDDTDSNDLVIVPYH